MLSRRHAVAALVFSLCCNVPASLSNPPAQALPPAGTKEFTDPVYRFSVHLPAAWKAYPRASSQGEPPLRLSLSTPNKNTLLISISRLPRSVAAHSEFERIAANYVNPVVSAYLKAFSITTVLGEKKEDQSDRRSMKFWQGTSALHASVAPAMLLSSHTIRYGSNLMVNIVYVSGNDSLEEVKAVDAVIQSLSFPSQ